MRWLALSAVRFLDPGWVCGAEGSPGYPPGQVSPPCRVYPPWQVPLLYLVHFPYLLSFLLLAHSFALFCTLRKLNPFLFKRFRTLCAKHTGVGEGHFSPHPEEDADPEKRSAEGPLKFCPPDCSHPIQPMALTSCLSPATSYPSPALSRCASADRCTILPA